MKRADSLLLSTALLAGCGLGPARPPAAAVEAGMVPPAPPPAPTEIAPRLRAWAWACDDGGTVVTRLEPDPPAVKLRLDGRSVRLPQQVAASGVRYADDTLQWWEKGSHAMLQRQPGAAVVNCSENRPQSLMEDARARGITFRGLGNEPGWLLEIGPAQRVRLDYRYGEINLVFDALPPRTDAATGQVVHEGRLRGHRVRFTIERQPCRDDMSGEAFPATVRLEVDGRATLGCGQSLGD